MTYNPDIPNTIDSPASQQAAIQTNFAQFAAIYSTLSGGVIYNHMPINGSQEGKHAAVLMESQATDPAVTNNYAALYAKNVVSNAGAALQLFARIQDFLPNGKDQNIPMQLTFNTVNTAGPQYQTFLAGGYVLYIGTSLANVTITLTPAPLTLCCVQATSNKMTVVGTSVPVVTGTTILTPSTFQIKSANDTAGSTFSWFAIGNINA